MREEFKDKTIIIQGETLPKKWVCPHCKTKNVIDKKSEQDFAENFVVSRKCSNCSNVHSWMLVGTINCWDKDK